MTGSTLRQKPRALDAPAVELAFNGLFLRWYNTRMSGGAQEPLYLPAAPGEPAHLRYRQDFAASALHEAAHWCIAGPDRRREEDFGYIYVPLPRSPLQQQRFFAAELTTQALERYFAAAAGIDFYPSADNLEADIGEFSRALVAHTPRLKAWLSSPAASRARAFHQRLDKARHGSR